MTINRRTFGGRALAGALALSGALSTKAFATTYLTVEQAQQALWGDTPLEALDVTLTREQMRAIRSASRVRVRSDRIAAWVTPDRGWFIADQVIGKHENIDLAVALTPEGAVKGIEVLTYRETYGDEIMDPRWRGQFTNTVAASDLRLGRNVENIGGATLSCRHVTDGVSRLLHTWDQVLRHI